MDTGISLRKNQIFNRKDGKSVIIAMDHGSIAGPVKGIEKPAAIIEACVKAKVDGILTTKGFVDASCDQWDRTTGLILRVTGGFTVLGGGFEEEVIVEPETTAAYGASCAALTVKFGHGREGTFIRQASREIDAYHRLGIPVMIEAMAKGVIDGKPFPSNDPGAIKMAARMAAELGADLVKTYYTGSVESFAQVTGGCPVPIVILGGAKTDSLVTVFQDIYDSLQAGGKGIAVGRNIWGHENLPGMLKAVNGLVHGNWTVDKALKTLEE
ncbi:fructose-bisphosphate aldolase [Spirochaetia bacterium]|nr:fructose-bisphosphate aldolase [Spirochaetia bacterium]